MLPDSVLAQLQFKPVEDLIVPILRDALPDIPVHSLIWNDQQVPSILVRRLSTFGNWNGYPRLVDVSMLAIQCYTQDPDGDRDGAFLSEAVRVALRDAALRHALVPGVGWLSLCDMISAPRRSADWAPSQGPVQYADLPQGVWRYETTYSITSRPDLG